MRRVGFVVAAGVVAALLSAPVTSAEPSIPLCTFGGDIPCFCPDDGGQMRTSSWQTCWSVEYGPWGDDQETHS